MEIRDETYIDPHAWRACGRHRARRRNRRGGRATEAKVSIGINIGPPGYYVPYYYPPAYPPYVYPPYGYGPYSYGPYYRPYPYGPYYRYYRHPYYVPYYERRYYR